MFAKMENTNEIPTDAAEAYLLSELATGGSVLVTLWDDAQQSGYEVLDRWEGPASGEQPTAASIVYFDGPVGDAVREAGQRGFDLRIKPALAEVSGYIAVITLTREEDGSLAVLGLATSMEALEAGGQAINSTELLPDEDPALLTGPDRVGIHRVVQAKTSAKA